MNTLFLLVILFFVRPAFADNKVFINEFLIDPQPQQVEIINMGSDNIDLSNWIIDDNGGSSGSFSIPAETILDPNSCLVFSKDFNFNKTTSDSARLFDVSMNLIDSFPYKSSPGTGNSYARITDGEQPWSTSSATLGFFNSTKLTCLKEVLSTPTPTIEDLPSPTPQTFTNVYISEAMVNPNPSDNEWVEFYNANDFAVSIIDWYVDDGQDSGSTPKKFSIDIPPLGFKVLMMTSPLFNNDGDSVRLLDQNQNFKDGFEYAKSQTGKSYGRHDFTEGEFCLQDATYEKTNNPCLNPTETPTPSPSPKPTNTPFQTPAPKKTKLPFNIGKTTIITPMDQIEEDEEVLGAQSTKSKKELSPVKYLSIVSFSYSLLTLVSVLFKMTGIYGKGRRFLSSFVDSP